MHGPFPRTDRSSCCFSRRCIRLGDDLLRRGSPGGCGHLAGMLPEGGDGSGDICRQVVFENMVARSNPFDRARTVAGARALAAKGAGFPRLGGRAGRRGGSVFGKRVGSAARCGPTGGGAGSTAGAASGSLAPCFSARAQRERLGRGDGCVRGISTAALRTRQETSSTTARCEPADASL